MRKFAIALSVCLIPSGLVLLSTRTWAEDWTVKGTLSQAVELNDNQFLKTMLSGGSLGSYSNIDTSLEGTTPSSKFEFDSGAAYKKYWGPGVDGLQSEYISYGFKAHYEEAGKTLADRSYLEASYGQQSAALALFSTLGLPSNASGYLNQTRLQGGIDRAITASDSVSLWARSIYTNYDPSSSGLPFTDTLAVGSWKHTINSALAFTTDSQVEYLNYDNLFNTDVAIFRELAGVEMKLSPLVSFRAAIGPSYVQINNGFGAVFAPTTPAVIGSGTPLGLAPGTPAIAASSATTDLVADALLTYRMLKTVTLSFSADRTVGPNIIGSITTQTSGRAAANYEINSSSGLAMYVDFTRLQDPSLTDFFTGQIEYTRALSQTWTAKISYRYIHRFTGSNSALLDPVLGINGTFGLGQADSNGVLMVLSKTFVAHPGS